MKKTPSKHKILKRVIIALVIFIISFALMSEVIAMCVFSAMFGRYNGGEDPLFYSYSDIDTDKYPREAVTFKSGDNNLRGYYYTTSSDSHGTVIVINGFRCTSDRHLAEIMYFIDNDWDVFTYDATGVGRSEGESQVGLSQFRIDASAAEKYVGSLSSKPIVLYGHSAGGYAAVTSLESNKQIKAVVSVSGFNSPAELMRAHTRENIGILADIEFPFMLAHNYFVFGNDANTQAYEAINSTDVPVAVFQGSNDGIVPYEISIYSHKNEINNPNAECMEIDSDTRGTHSGIWLSESAAAYTINYMSEPFANPDKSKANQLDKGFMEYVLWFYNKSVKEYN